MATIEEKFKEKYGNNEVELPVSILTIRDNYPSSFCSGSNGYLTKVRIRNDEFEFYHNWWAYGWLTVDEIKKEYPYAARKLDKAINCLI